jgi:hypothetical protein
MCKQWPVPARVFLRRHVAWPSDHGSWAFLLSPLLIGLYAGGCWTTVSIYLVVASLSALLIRQPITIAVKVYSGRRPPEDLAAAFFWTAAYAGIGLLHVTGLVLRGFGYVLYLAIPGIPIFAWYLYLVSRRAERRQMLVEVAATGSLALSAPAGLWVGLGRPEPIGWLLWLLAWAESAAGIVHAYLRLHQRPLRSAPDIGTRLRMGCGALTLTTCNLAVVSALCSQRVLAPALFLPYALQLAETIWCTLRPAIGASPRAIGYRQLAIHTLFTLLFILAWR